MSPLEWSLLTWLVTTIAWTPVWLPLLLVLAAICVVRLTRALDRAVLAHGEMTLPGVPEFDLDAEPVFDTQPGTSGDVLDALELLWNLPAKEDQR